MNYCYMNYIDRQSLVLPELHNSSPDFEKPPGNPLSRLFNPLN